ncbi:hypothetical protein GCM10025879_21360 [Leuconostoc litchii]|uniref:glycoside hydrolase domain-containing protein n=1 Tax=Leuconostoc litchii TaxID=1981069 RepID=UPI0023E9885D|nr:glycoside hydrolase domain-containing protein [Leuconostoc litchii]GMA70858.1 hypothetical protein GCM10025879_21050 [Leuconostoc litchii]GMA70889.1 hypothetical protein GCM10025879_21360 [Leuconostoc litchii]
MDSQLAQALFDMSAFVLVSGGDKTVRNMQQYLNANYRQYTGILPTDGIYQRATNTALIYGVQAELGLGDIANGFWGPTTISTYKSAFSNGLGDKVIKLIQYALYVNMKEYLTTKGAKGPAFTGALDSSTQNILNQFQNFMMLDPVKAGQPDSTTMYSLMLSSGNPARNFFGMDTSYQLDASMIKALVDYDVNYVGRYLTGSVGSGASERDKNLTRTEAQNIIDAGLKLVPIYQDNTPSVDYFTYNQGVSDAQSAVSAALNIGIPNGQTIYFAVDMDMTDDEITTAAIPYFQGIVAGISHYHIGVYGTRNVSSRVSHAVSSVLYSYVSNMSTGFSGNLGFSQPTNWAFDQFFEDGVGVGPLPALDRVAVSNIDAGVTYLVESAITKSKWFEDTKWQGLKDRVASANITWDSGEIKLVDSETIKVSVSMSSTLEQTTELSEIPMTFEIKNGKITPDFTQHYENLSSLKFGTVIQANIDKLSAGIKSGSVTVLVRPGNIMEDELPMAPVISLVFSPDPISINNNEYTIDWAVTFKMQFNTSPLVKEPAFETVQELNWDEIRQKWANGFKVVTEVSAGIVLVGAVAAIIVALPIEISAGGIAAIGALFISIGQDIK